MIQKPTCVRKQSAEIADQLIVALMAVTVFVLTGCAPISPNAKYLFAPEVRTCPPTLYSESGKSEYYEDYSCWARIDEPRPAATTRGQGSSLTVSQATNYARQIEEEYIGAKSEYGSISSATGLLLIPAGASALALGAEGGSAAAVSALGFGSAGVLGLGYWLSNSKREKVYMTGADALECLISTMQPFDVEQTDFKALADAVGDWNNAQPAHYPPGSWSPDALRPPTNGMANANFQVASHATYLSEELTILKSDPKIATDACLRPALCYAEQALKAAGKGTQAASKAYDAELKYQQFSQQFAGNAMVSVVNTINNKVNEVMTETEPNLQALANELSSAIPQSAQQLAGISSASSAAASATSATTNVNILTPPPGAPGTIASNGTVFGPACKDKTHRVDRYTAEQLEELFRRSEELQWRSSRLNSSTEMVADLTPGDITPKTQNCTKLFDQPGVAPAMMTLNPDGYIALTQGGNLTVAISGGQSPFAVRLVCDCYDYGVTAETKYDSGKGAIEISVSGSAKVGSYPVMVSDSTGISRVIIVVVSKKADDSADTPDCTASSGSEQTASSSPSEVGAVAQLAASAQAYANAAAKAAAAANAAASKTEKSHKASDAGAASAAASKAYSAAGNAQAKAAQADTKAAASNDPIIQSLSQAADVQAQNANASASQAAAYAARAAAAVPKPGA